jgi:putative peptide zinc metalloprotease protein
LDRSRVLLNQRALAQEQYREAQTRWQVCQAQVKQAQSQKCACQAKGALATESELARREKELADTQATLTLLEAGSRPEEIAAQRARLRRLQHEARYLDALQGKLVVSSSVSGLVTTPRLKEKVWQYLREGELICVIEEASTLEVEIALAEEEVARVQPDQEVSLKFRTLPFEMISATVDRIAPTAARTDGQGSVTVYCLLAAPPSQVRLGMSGYARVSTSRRPMGEIFLGRALRFVRTEFWW